MTEQLATSLRGPHFSTSDLAKSGDPLGMERDYSVVGYWKAVFGPYGEEVHEEFRNFSAAEKAAIFSEARRLVCEDLPSLADKPILLKEAIASSVSLAFQVWLHEQAVAPDYAAQLTLREYLESLPLLDSLPFEPHD